MAPGRRKPSDDLVHHSDAGARHTSLEFTNRLGDWRLNSSYGPTGDAYDNAVMETFWATAKKEILHLLGPVARLTRSQLQKVLFEYVEVFYNRACHQAALGHRTPAEVYEATKVA